jgi:hypothetical protein
MMRMTLDKEARYGEVVSAEDFQAMFTFGGQMGHESDGEFDRQISHSSLSQELVGFPEVDVVRFPGAATGKWRVHYAPNLVDRDGLGGVLYATPHDWRGEMWEDNRGQGVIVLGSGLNRLGGRAITGAAPLLHDARSLRDVQEALASAHDHKGLPLRDVPAIPEVSGVEAEPVRTMRPPDSPAVPRGVVVPGGKCQELIDNSGPLRGQVGPPVAVNLSPAAKVEFSGLPAADWRMHYASQRGRSAPDNVVLFARPPTPAGTDRRSVPALVVASDVPVDQAMKFASAVGRASVPLTDDPHMFAVGVARYDREIGEAVHRPPAKAVGVVKIRNLGGTIEF